MNLTDHMLSSLIFVGAPAYIVLRLHYIATHPEIAKRKISMQHKLPGSVNWERIYSSEYRNIWAFVLLWAIIDTITRVLTHNPKTPVSIKAIVILTNFALLITALYKLASFHARLFRKSNSKMQSSDKQDNWQLPL